MAVGLATTSEWWGVLGAEKLFAPHFPRVQWEHVSNTLLRTPDTWEAGAHFPVVHGPLTTVVGDLDFRYGSELQG